MNKYLFLGIISFLFFACGGKQEIVYEGDPPDRSKEELLAALEERNVTFDWFASKAKAKIESPEENVGGTVYLRLKKDSMIWMVFKKYSAEWSRMMITQDSFYIIYRDNSTYQLGSIAEVENKFNIDFDFQEAQELLVGNALPLDSNNARVAMESPYYKMQGGNLEMLISYWINGFDLSLEKLAYEDNQGREVTIKYGDYRIKEGIGRIPYLREYNVPYDDTQRAYFKLEFKDIEFEKPPRTIFRIPEHYQQVE